MKKSFLLFLLISVVFAACSSDDDDDDNGIENNGVPILSVKATACVDVSARSNWTIKFNWEGGHPYYKTTLDGDTLQAVPQSDDEVAYFGKNRTENEVYMQGLMPSIYVFFSPNDYFGDVKSTNTSVPPSSILVADQSTIEGLTRADALYCSYKGIVTRSLTDVKLIHKNALLDFELIGVPSGAKLIIPYGGSTNYTPYKSGENSYKVICLTQGSSKVIVLQISGKNYSIENSIELKNDRHYTFKLRFDDVNKKLLVDDMAVTVWSSEGDLF